MMTTEILFDLMDDPDGPACLCTVELAGLPGCKLRMVCQPAYGSSLDPRGRLLAWAGTADLPRGADWGYGLALARDLPSEMTATASGQIHDGAGQTWRIEAARPIREADAAGALVAVGWRFALRGTQRAVRG